MALISDYGGIKPSIVTYQPYQETIETICGLLLLYPITEEEFIRDGVIYHFFKKSFWGKKQLGYLKIEYLPGNHTDTSLKIDEQGNLLPPYTDIVIGIEYDSEYNSVNWSEQARIFNLASPNKQVLSYGFLIQNIEVQKNAIRELELEEIRSTGIMLMMNMGRMAYFKENMNILERTKATLKVFSKFLSNSEYQPVAHE